MRDCDLYQNFKEKNSPTEKLVIFSGLLIITRVCKKTHFEGPIQYNRAKNRS